MDTAAVSGRNPLFQVGLDVSGRLALVIGGRDAARERSGRLLDAGAEVRLVSPDATGALQAWAADGRLEWRRRRYRSEDLDGVFLVMNTVGSDPAMAHRIFVEGERRGILVNAYDDLSNSHFGMSALVAAGPLRIGISTSNASPALAGRLRRDLEDLFDDEFVAYVESLAQVRTHLKATEPDFDTRRELLRSLVADTRLRGRMHLPPAWRQRIQAALSRPAAEHRVGSDAHEG